ncbi:MAG: hypothetical protein Q8R82_06990 [Hyphomonadaceae bacterium]|nr:hypothetical protein [Hyphomonadaceae bacterium]
MQETSGNEGAGLRVGAIWLGAAIAVIVLYFVLVLLLAPGAPFMDDIHISESVERARAAANPWPELWSQHNEHRPVITKLIFWMQRAVAAPNYTLLAFIGNLSLLPIFAVLALRAWRSAGSAAGAAILFVATMTFSYTSADSMLWAMTAMSNYGVILFALLAFWMAGRSGAVWSIGALGSALLAGLSQGNGFLVLMLGCLFLIFDRRWIATAAWAAATAVFLALYFASYIPVAGNTDPVASLGRPFEVMLFALIFSGSALGYPVESGPLAFAMMAACAALGLLLWAVVWRTFLAARFRSTDPLLWFSFFLIASGGLAALSRLDTGFIQAMTPRYHVNSCLLIASCVVIMATNRDSLRQTIRVRRAMPLLALAGLAYIAVSTLTLWRMHSFYIEQTQGVPPPA